MTNVTLIAGGVGGAKMAEGFDMCKEVEAQHYRKCCG